MNEAAKTTSERPVLRAIAKIMGEVGAVEKRGENKFHNYTYATAADIAHALQKRMSAEGLVIVPNQREMHMLDGGAAMAIEFEFMVMHTSGDVLEERPRFMGMASCKNSKGGFDDKAANKCLTAASKYFSLNLFRIPTGDYHDADGAEDAPAPQSRQEPRQPPKAPARQSPSPANGAARASDAPTASKGPVDWEQGDAIPFGKPVDVDYVNTVGSIETVPIEIGIRKLRAAHKAPEDKLSNADWFTLYTNNKAWLEQHAPAVADELATRGA